MIVSCACCVLQVELSAKGRYLVQRSPTERECVCVCVWVPVCDQMRQWSSNTFHEQEEEAGLKKKKKESIKDRVSGAKPVDNKLASSICILYHSFLSVGANEANY